MYALTNSPEIDIIKLPEFERPRPKAPGVLISVRWGLQSKIFVEGSKYGKFATWRSGNSFAGLFVYTPKPGVYI